MRMKGKRFLSLALAAIMAASVPTVGPAAVQAAATPDYTVTVKGGDVEKAAENINGLTYKGFGLLNGNSTSNLLLDYKYEHPEKYNEMMQYLFGGEYPLFTHIKMEMGNDGNNSTGAEACTMRYEDEEADASRSPGFVMAADAKKINPNVKISILRWEVPKWVAAKNANSAKLTAGEGYEAVYKWYKETIFDAYEKYGYMVDFVDPDKNETQHPDTAFIKWFSERVKNEKEFPSYIGVEAQEAYNNIRIIASDENKTLEIVPAMRKDSALYEAVDIIGFHYRTNATDDYVAMADVDDKEVWYSEGCATIGYSELQENKTSSYSGSGYNHDPEYGVGTIGGYQGPLALVDSLITAFASSRRTHYMFQPAIGSFYEGIEYGHKELLSARDPWSGYIHYDPALYMLEHYAKFAKMGWEDSEPDTNDIWRVITNATGAAFAGTDKEHMTAGIDGNAGYMTLASPDKKDFSVVIVNNTRNPKTFKIAEEDMDLSTDTLNLWVTETDSYLRNGGTIEKESDGWYLTAPAYSISTATTLGTEPERAPADGIHNEDRAVLDTDQTGKANGVTNDNVLYADNFEYQEEPANYLKERGNEPRYMLDAHGAWVVENGRLKHELASSVAQWNGGDPSTIVGDFRWMDYMASVDVEIPGGSGSTWARLGVRSQTGMNWNGSGYSLELSGSGAWKLYRIGTVVKEGAVRANADGRYHVRVAAFGDTIRVIIDNATVASYKDSIPMLAGRVKLSSNWNQVYFDNLLVERLDGGIPYALSMVDGQDDSVSYEGGWTIANPGGGSADDWYRTMSVSKGTDARLRFPIKGSGFAILGTNDGSAKLDVYVDGTLKETDAGTLASPARGETYSLTDLPFGDHEIEVVVKSGTLKVDALYALAERLAANDDILASVKTEIPAIPVLLTDNLDNIIKTLPTEVEVETMSGSTVKKTVVWNTGKSQFDGAEFKASGITGTIWGGTTAWGMPLTVSVPVEKVIPSGTRYFIDSVEADPSTSELTTTEPYEEIREQLGDLLLNQAYDQKKTDDNSWGLATETAQTKGYEGKTTDMMATGVYAKNNEEGETLSYAFTLPAGTYKLISGHREWWGKARTMAATVAFGNKSQDAGTISLSGNDDYVNTSTFTLDKEQLVTYTLTAQNAQAPVISWLAVVQAADERHDHNYIYITDNGDGTHTKMCKDGDNIVKESHVLSYRDNINETTHTGVCICNYSEVEAHDFVNNVCAKCRAIREVTPETPAQPVLSNPTNEKAGIKLSWGRAANAAGYYVYRKTGKGRFQKAATINNAATVSWTDKKVKSKNGTSYQYYVVAFNGKVEGAASATKTIFRLTAAKLKSVKNLKGKKLQVQWDKNAKSAGYEIQYSTSKNFQGAKTLKISGGKKASAKISRGLKKKKTYYVRIRCYKKSSYSCWSSKKSIKVKK